MSQEPTPKSADPPQGEESEQAAPPPVEVERDREAKGVSTIGEAKEQLRRPFTPEAVKWKIQTNPKSENGSAGVVAYIDARLASARLNSVPGLSWDHEYADAPLRGKVASVLCRVGIRVGAEVEAHEDVGTSMTLETDMGTKALYSDAFKRACVPLGVGASLYAYPTQWIKASNLRKNNSGKFSLSDGNLTALRRAYAKWLNDYAVGEFGKPLDHGDVEGAAGDHEAEDVQGDETFSMPHGDPISDERLAQMERAIAFLVDGDTERVASTVAQITDKLGYVPDAALTVIGLTAATVKSHREAIAAAAADAS